MKSPLLCAASFSLVCVCVIVARQAAISSAYAEPESSVAAVRDTGRSAGNQAPKDAAAQYTIAFKSFAPNNSDVFLANEDGSHIRPLMPDLHSITTRPSRLMAAGLCLHGSAQALPLFGACIRTVRDCRD
jgi:hypothetical protein